MSALKTRFVRAVGLSYDKQAAPTVSVKGMYLSADEMVKLAKRFGVPVVEKAELAQVLEGLDIDQEIPEDLYEAVATILHQIDARI